MKKLFQLSILAILITAGATTMGQQTRVLRAHYANSIVFQTPTSGLDSIKADNQGYITVHYSDATWSRKANEIDSITFAMVSDGDTTIISDSVSFDTTGMIHIIWNGTSTTIINPYPTDSIKDRKACGQEPCGGQVHGAF